MGTGTPLAASKSRGSASRQEDPPLVCRSRKGRPGDPLNLVLAGSRQDLILAFQKAGWYPASRKTALVMVRVFGSLLLRRPYHKAPFSSLYLWNRRQDLAFEKPAGKTLAHRHHARFWISTARDAQGRALWLGAATLDRSVGISFRGPFLVHHIDRKVDQERDFLIHDLQESGSLSEVSRQQLRDAVPDARNATGDHYETDGYRMVAILKPQPSPVPAPPLSENEQAAFQLLLNQLESAEAEPAD